VKLFQLFGLHPNEVLSRDRLLNEVWGYDYYGTTRTLDQAVVQLRKKLADLGRRSGANRHRPHRRLSVDWPGRGQISRAFAFKDPGPRSPV